MSADTEFLTPSGWKRIDQYRPGDLVAQFYPETREAEFVMPLQYVKRPCSVMVAIEPSRGTSQRLSHEHRVLYYEADGTYGVCSAQEYMHDLHALGPNRHNRRFCTTYSMRANQTLPLSDDEIRLMVAVIADGHFGSNTNRCVVRVLKERKVARVKLLLEAIGVKYNVRVEDSGFVAYSFDAPRREKEFGEFWWGASQAQLEVIADELPHWDSAEDPRPSAGTRFSTLVEKSADFAQHAFSAAKRPTSLAFACRDRIAQGRGLMVEYTVHARRGDVLVGPGRASSVKEVPNPEGFKYCFEVPTSFLLLRRDGHIFATGNTGKTAVRIWAFEKRRKKKGGCALVLAQKSLLRSVWANDFKKFAPGMKTVVSTAGKHEKVFAEDADVYITNLDAVNWLAKQKKGFFAKFSELIIDESTAFKHGTSQRSKSAAKIARFFTRRALLTGTPASNSITDIWHQAFILDGGKRLGTSFYAFRNAVCEPKQVGANKNALHWTDKEGSEEAVFDLLSDITIRHKFEDCVDIPATHQYTVPFTMNPAHRKAYDDMQEKQLMEIFGPVARRAAARLTGTKLTPIATVSAIHAGVLAQKLLQIASGAVYESPDKYHVLDTDRYAMILDLIEARKHSLTFFLWKHQRDLLLKEAEKRGITYALIDGSVSESERTAIVAAYQRGAYQTIFAHPKSAAHGLTLTKGTATIWSSPTYDLEIFLQGSKRQARIGQTQKTEIVVAVAENTIEQKVYDKMLAKGVRMDSLLDLFSTL